MPSTAAPFAALSPGDVTSSLEPHHLIKQNAMFLLELAPSHSAALPLSCNTPSPCNAVSATNGRMTPLLKQNGVGTAFQQPSADFDAMLLPAVQVEF